jgi:hypothetical protein
MTCRFLGSIPAALAITISVATLQLTFAPAQEGAAFDPGDSTFHAIVGCLAEGKEYVMPSTCVNRGRGDETAKQANMPLGEGDWDKACQDKDDPRRLPADVIKRIAAQKEMQIAPSGIRILGAIFCHDPTAPENSHSETVLTAVDLSGLDLPYSLVIDHSAVDGDIDATNLRVKGDFSYRSAVILKSLQLNRARVEGSVYGNASFMNQLVVSDTEVKGTWEHQDGVIFSDSKFLKTMITGDLSLSGSAFSWFLIQSSRVVGTLNLNNTEARCSYQVKASTIGYLSADSAGFGTIETAARDNGKPIEYPWWSNKANIVLHPAIKKIVDAERARIANPSRTNGESSLLGCDTPYVSKYLQFYVFDSTVDANFCLTSFQWIRPKGGGPDPTTPVSIVALDGIRINGNLILDLWRNADTEVAKLPPTDSRYNYVTEQHKFEAIGLATTAFIFAFEDSPKPYFTYLDGLKFDRIHKATAACAGSDAPGLATHVVLPSVDDVSTWLDKNKAPSSQPFVAFVEAFEKAGESSTPLRVKRMTGDLWTKTARGIASFCSALGFDLHPMGDSVWMMLTTMFGFFSTALGFLSTLVDLVTTGFQWLLLLVADHGLRPGKVVWPIIITLFIFWCVFRFFGWIAFEPKTENGPPLPVGAPPAAPILWPMGWLFLFDRLLPAYKIREEHYSILRVFRKATRSEIESGPQAPGEPPYEMTYLGRKLSLRPLGDSEVRQVQRWLVILRLIGAVLAIFLLAAINALVR